MCWEAEISLAIYFVFLIYFFFQKSYLLSKHEGNIQLYFPIHSFVKQLVPILCVSGTSKLPGICRRSKHRSHSTLVRGSHSSKRHLKTKFMDVMFREQKSMKKIKMLQSWGSHKRKQHPKESLCLLELTQNELQLANTLQRIIHFFLPPMHPEGLQWF